MVIPRAHPPPRRAGRTRGERAASLVEYALLTALIAVACIGALTYFGDESGNSINTSADSIIIAG